MASSSYVEDADIWPLLVTLHSCLCGQITESGLPAVCACELYPGGVVALDYCSGCGNGGCGQAWVRLVGAYPSTTFPSPAARAQCGAPLAYQIEVGIARCAPAMGPRGQPPPVEALEDAVRLQMADMAAMRRAIDCCLGDAYPDREHLLGQYTPMPVQGDCMGGTWALTVEGVV